MSICCHNLERHAMQVHWVDELTNSNQPQAYKISFPNSNCFSSRESLAVDGKEVWFHSTHRHGREGLTICHPPFRDHQSLIYGWRVRFGFFRVNNERRVQTRAHLHIAL